LKTWQDIPSPYNEMAATLLLKWLLISLPFELSSKRVCEGDDMHRYPLSTVFPGLPLSLQWMKPPVFSGDLDDHSPRGWMRTVRDTRSINAQSLEVLDHQIPEDIIPDFPQNFCWISQPAKARRCISAKRRCFM
jgi:hypothetical protein